MNDLQSYSINDCDYLIVQGPDSVKFMQGQFTCDLNLVSTTHFTRGACCNAKGRMVASFDICQLDQDQYLLVLAKGLAETLQTHLKKYAVFFKTDIRQEAFNAFHCTQAKLSDEAHQALVDDFSQYTQPEYIIKKQGYGAGYDIIQLSENGNTVEALVDTSQSASDVQLDRVQAGLARVTTDTVEEFIPQMLNLQITHGVSFKKGCYTGQEIVARMQYLGKLKRHCYRISFKQSANLGDHVFNGDKSVGTLVNQASSEDGYEGLAVLEDKQLNAPLTLGEQATPIEVLCLPYEPQQGDES